MVNNKNKLTRPKNKIFLKLFIMIAGFCAFSALYWTYMSTQEPAFEENSRKYIFENIGVTFLAIYILISTVIVWKFSLYWPFLSKIERKMADERQLRVRQRVYEKSYRLFAVVSVGAFWVFSNGESQMNSMLWWFSISSYFAIPALLAAWQKDS